MSMDVIQRDILLWWQAMRVQHREQLDAAAGFLTADLEPYYAEALAGAFLRDIVEKLADYRGGWGLGTLDPASAAVLYATIRHVRPRCVVETGVASGLSSSFILQALTMNGHGRLYSIDLGHQASGPGSVGPPIGARQPGTEGVPPGLMVGWLVPSDLRSNWTLIVGDSRTELPSLLRRVETVDLFFHDSRHTYGHMTFEYRTAWDYLRDGGYLISDDIHLTSAFADFAGQRGMALHRLGLLRK